MAGKNSCIILCDSLRTYVASYTYVDSPTFVGRAPSSKAWESFSSALKNHLEGPETVERSGVSEPSTIPETTGKSPSAPLISDWCSYSHVSIISVTTESATNTAAGDDTTESAAITSAGDDSDDDDEVKSKPSAQLSPVPGELVAAYLFFC